ncbi:WW domain [Carpediemonas membranifera]|uniref:WW domain n=1 Tax=Carpediemonas membranifera TaxID=201153 RepID=A0A8J6E597_9EUKA|nr:WW domain [Carpediemonas membranifera]|eukprot:KAG9395467.1 WW domain [Carpediemonas membranifera]
MICMCRLPHGLSSCPLGVIHASCIHVIPGTAEDSNPHRAMDLKSLSGDELAALVSSWKSAQDPKGRTYFYHAETRKTAWVLPDEVIAAQDEIKRREERRATTVKRKPEPVASLKRAKKSDESAEASTQKPRQVKHQQKLWKEHGQYADLRAKKQALIDLLNGIAAKDPNVIFNRPTAEITESGEYRAVPVTARNAVLRQWVHLMRLRAQKTLPALSELIAQLVPGIEDVTWTMAKETVLTNDRVMQHRLEEGEVMVEFMRVKEARHNERRALERQRAAEAMAER